MVAKEINESQPKRGEHAEEKGDFLDEYNVNAKDLVHLSNSRGKHIAGGH